MNAYALVIDADRRDVASVPAGAVIIASGDFVADANVAIVDAIVFVLVVVFVFVIVGGGTVVIAVILTGVSAVA